MISNHAPLQGSGYKYTSGGDRCLAFSSCSFKKMFSLSCVTEKVLTPTVLCYTFKDSKPNVLSQFFDMQFYGFCH